MSAGWESLASTRMLDIRCAVCGHPLRDALSAEVALGPDCRAKYGYDAVQVTSEGRAEANKLIYLIADRREGPSVREACSRLVELGFTRLAARIFERIVRVVVERGENQRLLVRVSRPYAVGHHDAFAGIPGRVRDHQERVDVLPGSSFDALWRVLQELYPGERVALPGGEVQSIPYLPVQDGGGDVGF
ncbi:MAG TPA: DUF6011 domain-containing protein [Anaeromyxobacteraceae bacterium]|nr:DUF6011 domain-containing protein [Anaeromyxobacteraceae bacterium]